MIITLNSSIINRQSSIDNRQSTIINRQSSIDNRQSTIKNPKLCPKTSGYCPKITSLLLFLTVLLHYNYLTNLNNKIMTKKNCKSDGSKQKFCGSRKSKLTGLFMLAIIAGFILFAGSCNDSNHDKTTIITDSLTNLKKEYQMKNEQLEKNKEICLGVSNAIAAGEWDKVDELLADDFTYVGDGAKPINKQQYIGFMKNVLCSAMTDMDMKFTRVIAENDLVAVEYTNAMTNSGDFFGITATNKRVVATGHFIREVKNGKVTAEWQTTNAMGLMGQLGAIPGK